MASLKWNPIDAQGINPQASLQGFMAGMKNAADATQALADNEQKNNILIQNQLKENNASLAEYLKSLETPFDFAGAQNIVNIARSGGYADSEIQGNADLMGLLGANTKDKMKFISDAGAQYTKDFKNTLSAGEAALTAKYNEQKALNEREKANYHPDDYKKLTDQLDSEYFDQMAQYRAAAVKTPPPGMSVYDYVVQQLGRASRGEDNVQQLEQKAQKAPDTTSTGSLKEHQKNDPKAKAATAMKTQSNYRVLNATVSSDGKIAAIDANGNSFFVPDEYSENILKYSSQFGLAPEYVTALAGFESGMKADAVSKTGAKGLMQITGIAQKDVLQNYGDEWEAAFGDVKPDPFNPEHNTFLGTAYLSLLRDKYGVGDDLIDLYLAYNLGAGALSTTEGVPGVGSKALREALNDPNQNQDATLASLGLFNGEMQINSDLYSPGMTLRQVRESVIKRIGLTNTPPDPNTLQQVSQNKPGGTKEDIKNNSVGSILIPGTTTEVPLESVYARGGEYLQTTFSPVKLNDRGLLDEDQSGHIDQMAAGVTFAKTMLEGRAKYAPKPVLDVSDFNVDFLVKAYGIKDENALDSDDRTALRKMAKEFREALGTQGMSAEDAIEILLDAKEDIRWYEGDSVENWNFNKDALDAAIKAKKDDLAVRDSMWKSSVPISDPLKKNIGLLEQALADQKKINDQMMLADGNLSPSAIQGLARQYDRNAADIIKYGNYVMLQTGQLLMGDEVRAAHNQAVADAKSAADIARKQKSFWNKARRWTSRELLSNEKGTVARDVNDFIAYDVLRSNRVLPRVGDVKNEPLQDGRQVAERLARKAEGEVKKEETIEATKQKDKQFKETVQRLNNARSIARKKHYSKVQQDAANAKLVEAENKLKEFVAAHPEYDRQKRPVILYPRTL